MDMDTGYLATVYEVKKKNKWAYFGHERATRDCVRVIGKTLDGLKRKYRLHYQWLPSTDKMPYTGVSTE